MPRIKVYHLEGSRSGKEESYESISVRMGRQIDTDICFDPLQDPQVSGYHAEFRFDNGRWWITDLGSSNGTFLDDEEVATGSRVAVRRGSLISLGGKGPVMRVEEASSHRREQGASNEDLVTIDERVLSLHHADELGVVHPPRRAPSGQKAPVLDADSAADPRPQRSRNARLAILSVAVVLGFAALVAVAISTLGRSDRADQETAEVAISSDAEEEDKRVQKDDAHTSGSVSGAPEGESELAIERDGGAGSGVAHTIDLHIGSKGGIDGLGQGFGLGQGARAGGIMVLRDASLPGFIEARNARSDSIDALGDIASRLKGDAARSLFVVGYHIPSYDLGEVFCMAFVVSERMLATTASCARRLNQTVEQVESYLNLNSGQEETIAIDFYVQPLVASPLDSKTKAQLGTAQRTLIGHTRIHPDFVAQSAAADSAGSEDEPALTPDVALLKIGADEPGLARDPLVFTTSPDPLVVAQPIFVFEISAQRVQQTYRYQIHVGHMVRWSQDHAVTGHAPEDLRFEHASSLWSTASTSTLASGSPVFDADGRVVAIQNTTQIPPAGMFAEMASPHHEGVVYWADGFAASTRWESLRALLDDVLDQSLTWTVLPNIASLR